MAHPQPGEHWEWRPLPLGKGSTGQDSPPAEGGGKVTAPSAASPPRGAGPAAADAPQGKEAGHDSWLLSARGRPGRRSAAPGRRSGTPARCGVRGRHVARAAPMAAAATIERGRALRAHPARRPSRRCRHLAAGKGRSPAAAPAPRLPPAHRRRSRPRPSAPGPALPLVGPQRSLGWVRGRRPGRHLGAAEGMCVTYNMRPAPPRPSGLLWGRGARVRAGPCTAQGRGLGRGGPAPSAGRARAGAELGAGGCGRR